MKQIIKQLGKNGNYKIFDSQQVMGVAEESLNLWFINKEYKTFDGANKALKNYLVERNQRAKNRYFDKFKCKETKDIKYISVSFNARNDIYEAATFEDSIYNEITNSFDIPKTKWYVMKDINTVKIKGVIYVKRWK